MKKSKKQARYPLVVCVNKWSYSNVDYSKYVKKIRASLKKAFPKRKIFIHSEDVTVSLMPVD